MSDRSNWFQVPNLANRVEDRDCRLLIVWFSMWANVGDGWCCDSERQLVDKALVSKGGVARALAWLRSSGWIDTANNPLLGRNAKKHRISEFAWDLNREALASAPRSPQDRPKIAPEPPQDRPIAKRLPQDRPKIAPLAGHKEEYKNKEDAGDASPVVPFTPPESATISLWREFTGHTGPIAPSFKARMEEHVLDVGIWRDTLVFGASARKVAHSNVGLDWALGNYKASVIKAKADALRRQNPRPVDGAALRPLAGQVLDA